MKERKKTRKEKEKKRKEKRKEKEGKVFSLRTLGIYFHSHLQIYHTAMLTIMIVLCALHSQDLLITGSL